MRTVFGKLLGATSFERGSWRWAARLAELTAWGTGAVILIVINISQLDVRDYRAGLALVAMLGVWTALLYRVLIPRFGSDRRLVWAGIGVMLAIGGGIFSVLRGEAPSAQLIFVPLVVSGGLLGHRADALVSAGAAFVIYYAVAQATGGDPGPVAVALNLGIFGLAGAISGSLASELRSHYRAEQEEHRLATAVRLRLTAVLDAVDEAIIFSDRQGVVRLMNRRAMDLFDIDPDDHLGLPVVQLLRRIARLTEDPEEFMEDYQRLRDEPDEELRLPVEQILPRRRSLKLFSGPTYDEGNVLVGRIDVFTDETELALRAAEVERSYEEARKTAENYQRSLLPDSVPNLPRVSLVAHYVAAAGRRAVCGDFYDFVPFPDGKVGLVIGDVCGVGPAAASDAALARYTLRSFASELSTPVSLLRWLNTYLRGQLPSERFVRLLLCVLDPERAVLEYANAGHVPPVVFRHARREVEWFEEGGLALGIEDDADFKVGRIELEPGDTLVLYTDGLTEAPRNGRPLGQGKFGDLVAEYGIGTPGELVQALRRSVAAWTEGNLRDDLAILACQVVPDALAGEPTRELVLPNEPARVSEIRRFVGSFLADLRAPVDPSNEILLAVGEAAANAWRHGRRIDGAGEVRVRCALQGKGVVITVADDGTGFSVVDAIATSPDPFASGGRGLFLMRELMDVANITSSAEGTTVTLSRAIFE